MKGLFTLLIVLSVLISTDICKAEITSVYTFSQRFDHLETNNTVDIIIGDRYWGAMEISISSGYTNKNASGLIRKVFELGLNADNAIYSNKSRVSEAIGYIVDSFSIGDAYWNSSTLKYHIRLHHLNNRGNIVRIEVKTLHSVKTQDFLLSDRYYYDSELQKAHVHYTESLCIGTTDPGSFKLAVEGKIGAREVIVTDANPWPDYVFENDYKLPSLKDLKNHIQSKKHLPDIPDAEHIKENGISIGEMQVKLLKKIEELTLYIIDQNNHIEYQNDELILLKQRVTQLEANNLN